MPRLLARPALVAALALAAGACGDEPHAVTAPSGTIRLSQSAVVDSALAATPVARVALVPDTAVVVVGRTRALAPAARDSLGYLLPGRAFTWASSDTSIVTVDSTGTLTGLAVGTATVRATSGGVTGAATVEVRDGALVALVAEPGAVALPAGDSLALAATGRDAQQAVVADVAVRWTIDDTTVARVDSATGVLHALGRGTTVARAASGALADSALVTVVDPIARLAIHAPLDTLEAWDVRRLTASYQDSAGRTITGGATLRWRRADAPVRWRVSDTTVARIDSVTGALTGLDRGTVTVTATSAFDPAAALRGDTLAASARRVVVVRYRGLTTATSHACNLASGGIAWCWGLNGTQGRIGHETLGGEAFSATPVRVPTAQRFVQLASFSTVSCGLTAAGQAWCWGNNGWGVLGNGNTRMGQSHVPVPVAGNLTFRSLTAGADHVCGVTTDERLYCWGNNADGQFGIGTTRGSYTPVRAAPALRFASAEAGNDFTCALTPAGAAWCFGYAGLGNLGDGQRIAYGNTRSTTPVKVVGDLAFRALTLGQQYACGLTTAGRAYCWGRNGGRFGNGNGGDGSAPAPAAGELAFRSLSAGATHVCGVATDDAVWCWGANTYGQIGNDQRNGSTRPVRVGELRAAEVSAADIATGSAGYSCAIAVDRLTTWCWGKNDVGQLGTGTPSGRDAMNPAPSIVLGQQPLPRDSAAVAR